MAIKINFDASHNPEVPTFVLAKKNGDKLGLLNAKEIELVDNLNDASEITFKIYKYIDNKKCNLWEQIVDFKLVYCVEWNMWFEITVELDEATETIKTVFGNSLGHAELSQIMLYNIEINTEDDVARDDYKIPTVLYNITHPEASLLNRIMEKARHYTIAHVDGTIANIQRTFSFDDISIYDAFQEISEEINCLFVLHSNSNESGKIQRTISVYDLESNCGECGYRGEFTNICPECGSSNINEGYGNDTSIFITADELANDIQLTTDTDSIKNCFKLVAGDDLMTATIRNCNPNGTDYIWYIPDNIKSDMSQELRDKLQAYDEFYDIYQKSFVFELDSILISKYNDLIEKYKIYNDDLEEIITPISGYPALMNAYYNTIDLSLYLKSALMPTVDMDDTDAEKEAAKLNIENLSPVAVTSISNISVATADNAVLAMAKIIVDSRYRVKVSTSSLEYGESYSIWTGSFIVTNYSDEDDTATSEVVSIVVNDDYSSFVQQKLQKSLNKDDTDDLSISGLFEKSHDDFVVELKKYSLNCLMSFYNSCQSCIDILIEQGIADKHTWSGQEPNLYEDLYIPYLNKLFAIESEIKVRQDEVDLIIGVYDSDGELVTEGLQTFIEKTIISVQKSLNFENYLGTDLWLEFCAFRREDKYSNDNYISDGLSNTELFNKAYEFIRVAQKEIYKSAELQHSISTSLKNLLIIKKFIPLVNDFKVGNWLRILVDDKVYKFRLINYTIKYDDLEDISVDFSDTVKINSTIKSVQDVISQAETMATSYSSVQRQAQQGEKSSSIIDGWVNNGLDATATKIIGGADNQTQTWDEHGMLFKKYDSINDSYDDIQLKIINSTIAITDDNWETVKTAVGAYYYFHPETQKLTRAYGVNAEVIVGNLIVGKNLSIYNENGNMIFDDNGFVITNGVNSFKVDPNSEILLTIMNGDKNVFYIDNDGTLHITGDGAGIDVSQNADITDMGAKITLNKEAIEEEEKRAVDAENLLNNKLIEANNKISSLEFNYLTLNQNAVTFNDLQTDGVVSIIGSNITGTISDVVYTSSNEYGQMKINNGQIEWIDNNNNSFGSITISNTDMDIISGVKINIDSNDAINIGTSESYGSAIQIGREGRDINIVGNVYINGVLFTGSE